MRRTFCFLVSLCLLVCLFCFFFFFLLLLVLCFLCLVVSLLGHSRVWWFLFLVAEMDDDFYEGSAPQYNAFSSPGASAPPAYPKVASSPNVGASKTPTPSAPREGGDLRGKVNKIKVSEPTDLPFVVEGLKKIYKVFFFFFLVFVLFFFFFFSHFHLIRIICVRWRKSISLENSAARCFATPISTPSPWCCLWDSEKIYVLCVFFLNVFSKVFRRKDQLHRVFAGMSFSRKQNRT